MRKSRLLIDLLRNDTVKTIEGQVNAKGYRFAVVVARFNEFMTKPLRDGAVEALQRMGCSDEHITVVNVPGSFEIPLVCKQLAESGTVDGIVAIGAIIRGSTTHYELVCNELAKGLSHCSLTTGIPVGFGVITTENIEQAIERSGCKAGNKGAEAAAAVVEMVNVGQAIKQLGN